MIKVGVIGIGSMGVTHLDAYLKRTDAQVVALADLLPERRAGRGRVSGNIEGQAQGTFAIAGVAQYAEGMDLIADPNVQAVDICLPTPLHQRYAMAALSAGKHVLVEKPLCRTSAQARELAAAADRATGQIAMGAMCMRFWPAWRWLKEAIDAGTYGKVLSAQFRRVAAHPGGPFYSSGEQAGGGILDLHIHDTDFIQYCFGVPDAVSSAGYSSVTNEVDHVVTRYHYKDVPIVVAEGGWSMAAGFGFRMQYTVNFERATAQFDIAAPQQLMLWEPGQPARAVEVPAGLGYEHEIAYFLDCIHNGRKPAIVTLHDAARSVAIVEAEVRSVLSGRIEPIIP